MAYIKNRDKKELLDILEQLKNARLKKVVRDNNSWGDCSIYTEDYLSINEEWIGRAKNMIEILRK